MWDAALVPGLGESDVFEAVYIARLKALLAPHGLLLDYDRDRASIDTGLHMFLEGTGDRQASQVRVWFQAKGEMASTLPLEQCSPAAVGSPRLPSRWSQSPARSPCPRGAALPPDEPGRVRALNEAARIVCTITLIDRR